MEDCKNKDIYAISYINKEYRMVDLRHFSDLVPPLHHNIVETFKCISDALEALEKYKADNCGFKAKMEEALTEMEKDSIRYKFLNS